MFKGFYFLAGQWWNAKEIPTLPARIGVLFLFLFLFFVILDLIVVCQMATYIFIFLFFQFFGVFFKPWVYFPKYFSSFIDSYAVP